MKFRTAYELSPRFHCCTGDGFRNTYVRKKNIDGTKALEKGKKENLSQKIQLAANGTLVSDLIRRAMDGDQYAILPSEGVITDLTRAPSSLLDAHNQIIKARSVFESLPREVRSEFGGSFSSFMRAVEDGSFTKSYKLEAKKAPLPEFSQKQVDQLTEAYKKAILSAGGKVNE